MSTSKPWIKNYPPGVDPEIGPLAYSSLAEFFDSAFDRFGNRNVAESMGKFFTYHEIDRLSKDFASYLQSLHLEKGARVALMYPNVIEYLEKVEKIMSSMHWEIKNIIDLNKLEQL